MTSSHSKKEVVAKINNQTASTGNKITIVVADNAETITTEEFGIRVVAVWEQRYGTVIDETITGLLRIRDFLGLQLDHALGNITDEDFEKQAEEYLRKSDCPEEQIKKKLEVLFQITSQPIDAGLISEIFQCELSQAERILTNIIQQRSIEDKK